MFNAADFPNLLVGLDAPDDAAVYRIDDERAIIQTMDFFPPVVDDAYSFGAIAAANAMSDVYAMGGEVIFGLNIAAWREDLALELLSDIMRGGADKLREGGGVIAGGHTITDQEPKYGVAVTGIVNPQHILTKGGAHPGDLLILTKPLGTGILTTAGKRAIISTNDLNNAIEWMMTLNRDASRAALAAGIKAMTDITGFALAGHAFEMALAAQVQFRFRFEQLPLLDGALELAKQGSIPGGTTRNRDYLQGKVFLPENLSDEWEAVVFDPQTSGGLLMAVPSGILDSLAREFKARETDYWIVGEVVEGFGVQIA